jgi:hypothetical protein
MKIEWPGRPCFATVVTWILLSVFFVVLSITENMSSTKTIRLFIAGALGFCIGEILWRILILPVRSGNRR